MFVHIPKTAGRSIAKGLFNRDRPKHITASELKRLAPIKFENYYTFAFVRNPWDRMVSFHSMLKTSQAGSHKALMRMCIERFGSNDFESFIRLVEFINHKDFSLKELGFESNYELHPQYVWLYEGSTLICDFVGRYENLLGEYNNLNLHAKQNNLPRLGVSLNRGLYQTHYTPYTRDLIGCIFSKDIHTFEYEF